MPFRRTTGIVSNLPSSDPKTEADVIMTAAALGFAASYIEKDQPIQLDMDPLDVREPAWTKAFNDAVGKLDRAIADYLQRSGRAPKNKVHAGTSPGYTKGAVIVGVYALAGQTAPPSISAPVLSTKGRALYDQIKAQSVPQYTGRGAYTGFVDNKNTVENTDPVGPRSTARFLAPDPDATSERHPRWLPPADSPLWALRRRRGTANSYVPWGLIMGDLVREIAALRTPPARTVRVPESAVRFLGLVESMRGALTRSTPAFNRDKAREMLQADWLCDGEPFQRDLRIAAATRWRDGLRRACRWYVDARWLAPQRFASV